MALSAGTAHAQSPEFGDDSGEWAVDGACDDSRLEGPGTGPVIAREDALHGASDCARLRAMGVIGLRDHRSF